MFNPLLLLVGGAAALVYFLFKDEGMGGGPGEGLKGIPGAAANAPRPQDDPTRIPVTLPDGAVISTHPAISLAIHQAVSTGNVEYMRNTAKQLRALGWSTEASALEKLANQTKAAATSGKASSVTGPAVVAPTAAVTPDLPPALLAQLQQVVIAQNVAQMRAFAAKLRSMGYTEPAKTLEDAANVVATVHAGTGPTPEQIAAERARQEAAAASAQSAGARAAQRAAEAARAAQAARATQTTTVRTPPAVIIDAAPVTITPTADTRSARRKAADVLVQHLVVENPPKPKENSELVRQYQALAGRSVDGKYGPGDAKSLADPASGNHVPPPPRYWPKATYAKAVKQYEAWLTTKKYQDPPRASEWSMALAQAKRYYPS